MKTSGHSLLPLAVVLTGALFIRLAVMFTVVLPQAEKSQFAPWVFPDSVQIWETVTGLNEHGTYETAGRLKAWRMPVPALVFAAGRKVSMALGTSDPRMFCRIMNIAFDVLNVWLLWLLARRIFSSAAGWLAALGGALYPFHVYLSPLILSDTMAHTAVLLTVMALHHAYQTFVPRENSHAGGGLTTAENPRPADWRLAAVFLGLALAFSAWVKASLGLLIMPVLLYLAWVARQSRNLSARRGYRRIGALAVAVFLCGMSGWWFRNYLVFGEFVPLTTMGGFTLWESSAPGADGGPNHGKVAFPEPWRQMRAELAAGGAVRLEPDADRCLRRATWNTVRENPGRALELGWRKFRRTWNVLPNWEGARKPFYQWALLGSYLPVLLSALGGLVIFYRRKTEVYILTIPAVYLALVHSVFMGSIRYRVPAEGCLIVLAAGTLGWLLQKSRAQ